MTTGIYVSQKCESVSERVKGLERKGEERKGRNTSEIDPVSPSPRDA